MINISEVNNFTTLQRSQIVRIKDLLRDMSVQLDSKISLIIILFVISWFMVYVIIPRASKGIKELYPQYYKMFFSHIYELSESLFETIGIMCTLAILYICYVQGIIMKWHTITLIVIASIVLFLFVLEFIIPKIRDRKKPKIKIKSGMVKIVCTRKEQGK